MLGTAPYGEPSLPSGGPESLRFRFSGAEECATSRGRALQYWTMRQAPQTFSDVVAEQLSCSQRAGYLADKRVSDVRRLRRGLPKESMARQAELFRLLGRRLHPGPKLSERSFAGFRGFKYSPATT